MRPQIATLGILLFSASCGSDVEIASPATPTSATSSAPGNTSDSDPDLTLRADQTQLGGNETANVTVSCESGCSSQLTSVKLTGACTRSGLQTVPETLDLS